MSPESSPLLAPGRPIPGASVMSPSPFYLTGEEALRVSAASPVTLSTLAVSGRVLLPDGTISVFSDTFALSTSRTLQTKTLPLPEGWLLGVSVRASTGSPSVGQTWALLELVRGLGSSPQVLQTLAMGSLTANTPLAWPGGALEGPTRGGGWIRSITGTDPAAGAEISETVPTGARWKIVSIEFTLVTDATVANREPILTLDDGATEWFRSGPSAVIAATGTVRNVAAAFGAPPAAVTNFRSILLPPDLVLSAGFRIRTSTTNLQAGDNYGAPVLLVTEWLEGT